MNLSAPAHTLLTHLSATWPPPRPSFAAEGGVTFDADGPLVGEVVALADGQIASLPYYRDGRDEVAWVTVAPDAESLRIAVADLRAWVIPSLGWEDPRRPTAGQGAGGGNGAVADALAALAPAGYFRWRTRRADAAVVAGKLKELRGLLANRPRHAVERVPSLLELRQLFQVACAAGNREAAEGAVDAIDHHQLDTASNTAFMRILLADAFGDAGAVVAAEETRRLVALRLPGRVRTAILHAYHQVHLRGVETNDDLAAAAVAYAERVDPDVGGLVAAARAADGPIVARLRGYRASLRSDAALAAEALGGIQDDALEALLRHLVAPPNVERPGPDPAPAVPADVMAALAPRPDGLVAEAATRSWLDWVERIRSEHWAAAARFVDDPHPPTATLTLAQVDRLSFVLEDLYTGGDLRPDGPLARALMLGLPPMIQALIADESFPKAGLADVYEHLLLVWTHLRRGSLIEVEGQLLLSLADAVLRAKPAAADQVASEIRQWWDARPVRAMLPFGFEALDVVLDLTANRDAASSLWYAVADVAHQNLQALSPTDRSLLHYLARRIGINVAVVDGYVPPVQSEKEADPLVGAGLRKIAILHSWAADAARRARDLILARCGADVTLIQAEEKTPSVRAAGNNDLLLFLHRRSAHQLFYGLDASARDKIVYVPGVTATSIVLALEQWVQNRGS